MRKQLIKTVQNLLLNDNETVLLLGDIGVFGFRDSFKEYPDRVYNIGILEQTTVGLASGLSMLGLKPIVHTIAPFLVERALEQLKLDFGYQSLNGNFVSIGYSYDYAGLGPTHHCPGDVQQLLTIPNMDIILPGTSEEFNQLFNQSYDNGKPSYYRLSEYENKKSYNVELGRANLIKKGKDATIICVGNMLQKVIDATENMDVTILYYTSINPFDSELLIENFNTNIIVVEPYYEGGLNYKINKSLEGKKYFLYNIGVPIDYLTNYGTKNEHDKELGLDSNGIKEKIKKCIL
jgi:transketolase